MATVDDGEKTAIAEFKPIKDLETEFNSMVTKFRNELQNAHASCNTMSSESKTRQGEIVQLKKAIKQKEESHSSTVTKFRNELQNAHSRCNTMSSESKTRQGEMVQLQKAILQIEKSHSREQRDLQKMKEHHKTHTEKLYDHMNSMNTKIKEINCEHSKETEQLKFELNEANHSLTSKINEEKIRTTEMEYRMHRIGEENAKYTEIVKNLNAEVITLKSEKEQLLSNLESLRKSNKVLQHQLDKEREQLEYFSVKISKRENELKQQKDEHKAVKDSHKEQVQRLKSSYENERKQLQKDVNSLKSEIDRLKNANNWHKTPKESEKPTDRSAEETQNESRHKTSKGKNCQKDSDKTSEGSDKPTNRSGEDTQNGSENMSETSVQPCDQSTSETGEKGDKTFEGSDKPTNRSAEDTQNESENLSETSVQPCDQSTSETGEKGDKTFEGSDKPTNRSAEDTQNESENLSETPVQPCDQSTSETGEKRDKTSEDSEKPTERSAEEKQNKRRLCTMESEAEINERRISELKTMVTQTRAQAGKSKEMMKQIAKLEAKIKEDETKARQKDEELKKTSRTVKDLEKKTSEKEVYIGKVRELNKLVDDERKNFLDLSWQYNQHIQQNNDFSERLRQAEKEKCDLKLEKDELLLRLSKLSGANLTFNNPNIADLSDEKRPTKLAEEFSELYDNEWTDAFEVLLTEDEKEKTTVMLKLLEHANRLCNELSTEHKRKIEDSFCTITFRETVSTVEDIEEKSETCTKEAAAMTGGRTNDIAVQTETCDGSIADENLGQEESHSQKTTTEARETTSKDAATQVNRTGTHDELETNEEVDGTAINEERDTENGSKGNKRNQGTDDVDKLVNDGNGNTVIGDECEDLCARNDDDGQVGNEGLAIDVKERSMSGGSERCLNVCTGKSSNVGNEGDSSKYNKHRLGACSIGDGSVFNDERPAVGSGDTLDVENPCKSSSSANRVGDEYDGTEVRSDFGNKGTADDDKDSQNEKDLNVGSMTGANDDKEGVSECSNEVGKHGNEGNVGACNNGQEDGDGVKKGAAVIRTEEFPGDGTSLVGDAQLRKAGHVTTVCNKAFGVDKKYDVRHVHNGNDDADDRNDDKLNVGYTYNMESSIRKIERKAGTDFEKKLRNEQKKTIMEVGKLFEAELSGEVEKVGTEIILKEQGIDSQETTLAAYVKKCVNICWSMCRHVPPVHIDFPDITEGVTFDTNKYKPYMKSGKYVHFIVWPALYLHAGGALLSKGVAQGRK